MADATKSFQTKVSGHWSPRHTIFDGEGQELGVLRVTRNKWGLVSAGEYRPERGEVLSFRRDPGLLRAQFSVWTDGKEWLGSSLRWHIARRQIDLWTGGKPYRVVPTPGLGRGWRMVAVKTGEAASFRAGLLGRGTKIEVHRKLDFELVLFTYFLGQMTLNEWFIPTTLDAFDLTAPKAAAGSKA